ncbi:MAG: AI-2E family transporter [Planctomycetales bacterium]|nr:AI-2E family transporter [Planctomycetales bacterium]
MSRLISFAVLIGIIVVLGLLFYRVLIGFFIPVFLAAVLVVVFRPLHHWVLAKTNQRKRLAAALTTLLIMVALMLPVGLALTFATIQCIHLIDLNDPQTLELRLQRVRGSLRLEMPPYRDQLRSVDIEIGRLVELLVNEPTQLEDPRLVMHGERVLDSLSNLQDAVATIDGEKWRMQFDNLAELAVSVTHPAQEEVGTEDEQTKPSASMEPGQIAVDLKSQFSKLKTSLLGGGFLAFARETANPTKEDIARMTQSVLEYVRPRLLSITGATGTFLVKLIFGTVILTVATFFFFYDGPAMIKTVMHLSPLDDKYEEELLLEFDRISRAVVLATLLSAITQGLVAGLGYAVVGMNFLTLLIILTTIFAMVPFVGPAVVWVPVCLYVGIYEERINTAILLALWGVLVVGTIDNVVKALVLHGQSQLHPLLALLSVLGGVQALGPIGIVVGPMVVALLQTLLSILQRELMHFEDHGIVFSGGTTVGTQLGTRRTPMRTVADPESAADKSSEASRTKANETSQTNQSPTKDET